jgi:membrane protein DedA with SNARE-associated domain
MIWVTIGLALSTLVSEDATALGAGVLARNGSVSAATATAAVALGIWVGDMALYLAGRLAHRCGPVARWTRRRWRSEELQTLARRLERGAPAAIVLSRMLPGTRVPLYVAAGLVQVRTGMFVVCTALAATAWTAAIVMGLTWLP